MTTCPDINKTNNTTVLNAPNSHEKSGYTDWRPTVWGGSYRPPSSQWHSLIQGPGDIPNKQHLSSLYFQKNILVREVYTYRRQWQTTNKSFWKCNEYDSFKCWGCILLTVGVISMLSWIRGSFTAQNINWRSTSHTFRPTWVGENSGYIRRKQMFPIGVSCLHNNGFVILVIIILVDIIAKANSMAHNLLLSLFLLSE